MLTPVALPNDPTVPGGYPLSITGVNDNGLMVGNFESSGTFATYNYETGAVAVAPLDPNGVFNEAYGINDAGEIVGGYSTSTGVGQAFSYKNGSFTDVNIHGVAPYTNDNGIDDETRAYQVLNNGTIVVANNDAIGLGDYVYTYIVSQSGTTETSSFEVLVAARW